MQDQQQPAPDFGEPWQADKTWPQIICNNGGIHAMVDVFDKTPGLRERIIATMNACAGMVDPAAEIQALRLAAPVLQPIETAPKDGTRIDVWLSESRRRVTNCYWGRPSHTCGENEGYCDSCPDHDGWVDGEDFMNGYTDEEPTHWMPLPTPPQV